MAEPSSLTAPDPHELQLLLEDPTLLEDHPNPAGVVPRLAAQSFVTMARKLRDEGRLELLIPYASADQLTSLLDLDVWRRDRVDVPRARGWLLAIVECLFGSDHERGSLTRLMHGMDPEFWTFALAHGTEVIQIDPDRDDSRDQAFELLAGQIPFETPDGFFVVGAADDEIGRSALQVLLRVYQDSLAEGRRLTLSILGGVPSQIEEDLLRWRSGRLADLGFVEWDEAMKLFRPLDREAALERAPHDFRFLDGSDPGADLTVWRHHPLLRRVLDRLDPQEHGIRGREFLLLVNEVSAAQRLDPGDESSQQRAIDQTAATLELGLELLAAAKPDHPDPPALLAERLRALGLRDLFRVGYGALAKLRAAALKLHRQGRSSLETMGSLLDRPWGPTLASLGRWYPELPRTSGRGTRPLRGLHDVTLATRLLHEAASLIHITFAPAGYAVDPTWITRADEPERIVLGDLVRTAFVHDKLPGSRGPLAPLTAQDIQWAATSLLENGRLREDARADFLQRCREAGIEEHGEALAENLLTRLAVELSALEFEDGQPDLTRIGGVLTIQSLSMWLKTTQGWD